MKTLLVGWFSFKDCNVTAGDVMARDLACSWLEKAGCSYDVALAPPFSGGVDWQSVDANCYQQVVFVCGPFPCNHITLEFLRRFNHCKLVGLDLSMIESVSQWNPFDLLFERDSTNGSHPDIAFLSQQPQLPVVGVILVHPQPEYGNRANHELANEAIKRLIASRQMVAVPIDTGLDPNTTNLRNAAEVESLIARMDLVITTRLHGTVLALKNGVPVIAIDPIWGGAKVMSQANRVGWEMVYPIADVTDEQLQHAFDYCLTPQARARAMECGDRAKRDVEQLQEQFINALQNNNLLSHRNCSPEFKENLARQTKKQPVFMVRLSQAKGMFRQWLFKKLYRPHDLKWIASQTALSIVRSQHPLP